MIVWDPNKAIDLREWSIYGGGRLGRIIYKNPLVRLAVAYIQGEARWARWRHRYTIVSDSTVIITIIK